MTDKSAEIHHDREMRFVARMGSGHEVVMDDRNGDSGARPTELVLAGLGGCTAMDVTSVLRKKRQEVTRLDVRVGATQREAYPQIFTDIDLLVEVEGPRVSVEAVVRPSSWRRGSTALSAPCWPPERPSSTTATASSGPAPSTRSTSRARSGSAVPSRDPRRSEAWTGEVPPLG